MLKDKTVVIGVSGGIAVYKTLDVVSRLRKLGVNVNVIMTKSATEFVTPLSFQSLSQNYVVCDMFEDPKTWDVEHISLAKRADVFLIAPATANVIGKIANGIADDMLTTTVMATKAKVLIAPAMNTNMYENPILQRNINTLKELGYNVGGFNAFITSDVLMGAGLSSSAAFETIIGTIISGLYNDMTIDPVVIAQVGQYAENVYFGKPCGLMDQCASSVGSLINIDFNDVAKPIVNKVDVDFSKFGHSLCIVDTKGSHADLTDEYAAIPMEMKKVANYFGKEFLREVDEEDFFNDIAGARKACQDRAVLRAIHLFEENKRVDQEVKALNNSDFETFKKVVKESGDSSYKFLQNVYANCDVQNQSVSIGLAMSEKIIGRNGVCRVHGGGFAGTIQAFVKDEFVTAYKTEIERVFGKGSCHVLKVRKYGGKKVI